MAQDAVIHHRRTEIDVLNGAIARYGERLGVPTPYNSVLADIVSCVQDNYNNQYGMENGEVRTPPPRGGDNPIKRHQQA